MTCDNLIYTSSFACSNQLAAGLQIGQPEHNEVSGAETRKITFRGSRLLIKTPGFFRKAGLKFTINPKNVSVLVPLDEGTRQSLRTVEEFVKTQVAGERYKPLFLGNAFYVNVSRFCKYEQVMSDGKIQILDEDTFMGSGDYVITLHVSHCYIGPHKGGETFSVSLQVSGILHRPRVETEDDEEEDVMDLIESLTQDINAHPTVGATLPAQQEIQPDSSLFTPPTPFARKAQPTAQKSQRKRNGGRQRGFDEIDGAKPMC